MNKIICTLLHHRGHVGDKMWDSVKNQAVFTCSKCGTGIAQNLDIPAGSANTFLWIAMAFLVGAGICEWILGSTNIAMLDVLGFFVTLFIHHKAYNSGMVR